MTIFLIGMPASGKSTLGRGLARRLGYRFTDMDAAIEQQQGQPIAAIFQQEGEAFFRELERDALRRLSLPEDQVVSTGGGMPCFHENMKFMLENGLCIFLDVPPAELARRVQANPRNDRPLLSAQPPQALLASLTEKRAQRLPFYTQAPLHLSGADLSIAQLHRALQAFLKEK